MDNKVDFYAVSFVKDAQVVYELKNYLQSNYSNIIILHLKNVFEYHVLYLILTNNCILHLMLQALMRIYMLL